jgi:hypothetical protein
VFKISSQRESKLFFRKLIFQRKMPSQKIYEKYLEIFLENLKIENWKFLYEKIMNLIKDKIYPQKNLYKLFFYRVKSFCMYFNNFVHFCSFKVQLFLYNFWQSRFKEFFTKFLWVLKGAQIFNRLSTQSYFWCFGSLRNDVLVQILAAFS